MRKITKISIPMGLQFYPDIYDCWAKTSVNLIMTGAGAAARSFHLNSPGYLFGPQTNYTGSFGNNVPAGMNYLFGSDSSSGASAPYFYSRTVECLVDIAVVNGASIPVSTAFISSTTPSFSATSFESLIEQRGIVYVTQPASSTLSSNMFSHVKYDEIFGISKQILYNDPNYRQNPSTLPSYSIYGHIVTAALDGSSNLNTNLQVTFRQHIQFSQRNDYNSIVPTLLTPFTSSKDEASSLGLPFIKVEQDTITEVNNIPPKFGVSHPKLTL
jgi:hypothetical protein